MDGAAHAGAYSANRTSIAAALATLEVLAQGGDRAYLHLDTLGRQVMAGLEQLAPDSSLPLPVHAVFHTYFGPAPIETAEGRAGTDHVHLETILQRLQEDGVRPTAQGTWFMSSARTPKKVSIRFFVQPNAHCKSELAYGVRPDGRRGVKDLAYRYAPIPESRSGPATQLSRSVNGTLCSPIPHPKGFTMLNDIRVIDLTHHMAGPYCTQKLADMGADVIKVEPPLGEWSRRAIAGQYIDDIGTGFATVNRGKRGLAIDLKTDAGRKVLLELIKGADVLVVNMRPDAVKRLGLDYETAAEINSRLIYAAISGFGDSGPLAWRPGQDLLIQAFTGVAWNAGRSIDPPVPAGTPFVDVATSHLAVVGILGALIERWRTGLGQKLSVTMVDAAIDVQATEVMGYLNNDQILERSPYWSGHPTGAAPYGIHQTKDGYIAIAFGPYAGFANAMDLDVLRVYTSWDDGYAHRDEIYALIVPELRRRTTDEWIDRFDRQGIWCGVVNDYKGLFSHPHIVENGYVEELSRAATSFDPPSPVPGAIQSRPTPGEKLSAANR